MLKFGLSFYLLFALTLDIFSQNESQKIWYDLEKRNLNEHFYNRDSLNSKIINSINDSENFSFFSLFAFSDYNRYQKFDRNGRLIADAQIDSISPNDKRARFQIWLTSADSSWVESKTQLNPYQENWRFYTHILNKKVLTKERIIEYYKRDKIYKGIAWEIEHYDSTSKSIIETNIDSIRNANGLLTKFKTIQFENKKVIYTPFILWQVSVINNTNVGTARYYFPYSGELGKEIIYKNGKVKSVKCISYFVSDTLKSPYLDKVEIVYTKKNVKVFDKKGEFVRTLPKHYSNRFKTMFNENNTPKCQCEQPYFLRETNYINENEYILPFLENAKRAINKD